jgi:hypothetical protein
MLIERKYKCGTKASQNKSKQSKHHTTPRCPSGLYSIGFIVHSFLTVRQCFLKEHQGQRHRNAHGHIHQQCTPTDAFAFHRHLCNNGTNNSNDVHQNTGGVGETRNKNNTSTGQHRKAQMSLNDQQHCPTQSKAPNNIKLPGTDPFLASPRINLCFTKSLKPLVLVFDSSLFLVCVRTRGMRGTHVAQFNHFGLALPFLPFLPFCPFPLLDRNTHGGGPSLVHVVGVVAIHASKRQPEQIIHCNGAQILRRGNVKQHLGAGPRGCRHKHRDVHNDKHHAWHDS